MPFSQHIITKQKLDINFNDAVGVNELSANLSAWVKEMLNPAIEQVLADLDNAHHRIRIDKISIDAGTITGKDWQQQLTLAICNALRQKIREAAVIPLPLAVKNDVPFYSENEKQKLVLHYLKTGSLPWYAAGVETSELFAWIKELLENRYFKTAEATNFFIAEPVAFHRFLLQTSPALLEAWFNQWQTAKLVDWLPSIILAARKWFGQNSNALVFSYGVLFDAVYHSSEPLWQGLLEKKFERTKELIHLIRVTKGLLNEQESIVHWKEVAKEQTLVSSDKLGKNVLDRKEEFFIANAGLVLLHPFLKIFFTNVNLLDDKSGWIDEAAQGRGVLLLHYICTASTEIAEYELPLCKLIAGYPFHQPVRAAFDLTDHEKTETHSLLKEVISKWTILKTTSPAGFQKNFLAREGKLCHRESRWQLQVEQKPYDMLLDHLPWSIGIIKNNWMEELLFTDWV